VVSSFCAIKIHSRLGLIWLRKKARYQSQYL